MDKGGSTLRSVSQQAAIGAAWIIAWRLATRNLGLLSTLILVRLLQPSDFGLVALANGFIASVDALSAIGVQDALVRASNLDHETYDTGFALTVLRGILTSLLIAGIAWPVGDFFADHRLTIVMIALSTGTLLSAFENVGTIDFRRDLAFHKEFNLNVWPRIAGVMVTVATALIWHSYWALVTGLLFSRVVRLPLTYWMSPYRPRFSLRAWRRIIGFSLWAWAQTMLYQLRERSDAIFVGRLLGPTQVGVFSVGAELGALPTTEFVEPLGRALFSGFASLHNASQSLGAMFLGAVGVGFLLILPAGLGISMVADPMVRLSLGEQWIAAVPVVQIMALGSTTAIFVQSCATLLNAIGRPNVTFYIVVTSTFTKLLALLLLVPRFGLRGTAMALLLSSVVELILFLGMALPRVGISLRQLISCAIRPVAASLAMVTVLEMLGMAWTPTAATNLLQLILDATIRSLTGATCYMTVLILIWSAVGRPDGAEYYLWKTLRKVWARAFA